MVVDQVTGPGGRNFRLQRGRGQRATDNVRVFDKCVFGSHCESNTRVYQECARREQRETMAR